MMFLKEFAIDTFDLAQWNVLRAIMRLKHDDLMYQVTPRTNPVSWILGHLTWHMDLIFNRHGRGKSQLKPELRDHTAQSEEYDSRQEDNVRASTTAVEDYTTRVG